MYFREIDFLLVQFVDWLLRLYHFADWLIRLYRFAESNFWNIDICKNESLQRYSRR